MLKLLVIPMRKFSAFAKRPVTGLILAGLVLAGSVGPAIAQSAPFDPSEAGQKIVKDSIYSYYGDPITDPLHPTYKAIVQDVKLTTKAYKLNSCGFVVIDDPRVSRIFEGNTEVEPISSPQDPNVYNRITKPVCNGGISTPTFSGHSLVNLSGQVDFAYKGVPNSTVVLTTAGDVELKHKSIGCGIYKTKLPADILTRQTANQSSFEVPGTESDDFFSFMNDPDNRSASYPLYCKKKGTTQVLYRQHPFPN